METVFRKGTKVYDSIFNKNKVGIVENVTEYLSSVFGSQEAISVNFEGDSFIYSLSGRMLFYGSLKINYLMPITLSTSPYEIGEIK